MHIPVLQEEAIEYLNPKPNENFIDGTFGEGGHAAAILRNNIPDGKVLGIEADGKLYEIMKLLNEGTLNRLTLVNDSYTNLKEIVERHNFRPVNGVLLDLGISKWHLEESGRGFSFQKNEPLDMRFFAQGRLSAEMILNYWPENEIEKILREYGEERFSRRIAQKIAEVRQRQPIKSTFQLVEIIKNAVPFRYKKNNHFPAKTFQAVRIAVNGELENIKKVLPIGLEILEKEGRLAVISFHSLEDRIVKTFFKENAKQGKLKIINKKPIVPSFKEVEQNPSSKSAKLRVGLKI